MTKQAKTKNLNYLIGPALLNSIDYLFYHSKMKKAEHLFQSIIHQVEIKSFNVLNDGKSFFGVPIEAKKKNLKKLLK